MSIHKYYSSAAEVELCSFVHSFSPLSLRSTALLLLVSSQVTLGSVDELRDYMMCVETLGASQRQLVCIENREFYAALRYAELVARHECQRAFKDEPWNCSSFSILKEPKITREGKPHDKCFLLTHHTLKIHNHACLYLCVNYYNLHAWAITDQDLIHVLRLSHTLY